MKEECILFNISEHLWRTWITYLLCGKHFFSKVSYFDLLMKRISFSERLAGMPKNFKLTQIISLMEYRIFMNLKHNGRAEVTKPCYRTAEKNVEAWESLQGFNHAINERSWTGPPSTNVHLTSMGCSNIAHCVHLITVSSGKFTLIFLKLISPKN